MSDKITARDEKLLRREGYIRRERYVCIGLSVMILLAIVVTSLTDHGHTITEYAVSGGLTAILYFLGYAYYCILLIRHIESIKAYRSEIETR